MQSLFLEVYTNLPIRTDNSQTLAQLSQINFSIALQMFGEDPSTLTLLKLIKCQKVVVNFCQK